MSRGGKRENAGRKPRDEAPALTRVMVRLTDSELAIIDAWGLPTRSEALRFAVREADRVVRFVATE